MKEYLLFGFVFLDEMAPTLQFISKGFNDPKKAIEAAKQDRLHQNFLIAEKDTASKAITPFEVFSK